MTVCVLFVFVCIQILRCKNDIPHAPWVYILSSSSNSLDKPYSECIHRTLTINNNNNNN